MGKNIDVIKLQPYWPNGAVVVSVGGSAQEVWEYVERNHIPSNPDKPSKYFKQVHRRWKNMLLKTDYVRKMFESVNKEGNNKGCLLYDEQDDGGLECFLIILNGEFDPSDYEDMITLGHECLHVCQKILPIFLDRNEEMEAEAYFHSYLMREVVSIVTYK